MSDVKPGTRRRCADRIRAAAWPGTRVLIVALIGWGCAVSAAPGAPLEHVRGIYLQQAIEVATVGSRTVYLTRMTRFRRCGRFRGLAEDFNDHLVDVAGIEVPGVGFVAGLVSTIEGCTGHDGPRTGVDSRAAPGGTTNAFNLRSPSAPRTDLKDDAAAPARSRLEVDRTSRGRTGRRR